MNTPNAGKLRSALYADKLQNATVKRLKSEINTLVTSLINLDRQNTFVKIESLKKLIADLEVELDKPVKCQTCGNFSEVV